MIKSSLTVIILSNRPKLALAALDYYSSLDLNVIFSPGSSEAEASVLSKFNFPSSVAFLKSGSPSFSLRHRLLSIMDYITTPYFVFANDDDMLIPRGLNNGVGFLESNLSCSNYFGVTATMLHKSHFFPIVSPCYDYSSRADEFDKPCFATFKQYRSYPLFCGISRTQVLKSFLSLLPRNESVWLGCHELNYAIAVSIHGSSFYDRNEAFLLRLVHQPSRSSHEDYPLQPSSNESCTEYLERYINLDGFTSLMRANGLQAHILQYLRILYDDVRLDSLNHDFSAPVQAIRVTIVSAILSSFWSCLRRCLSNPVNFLLLHTFIKMALYYSWHRSARGIEFRI